MSKKDQYKLNFSKVKDGNRICHNCTRWGNLKESPYLSELLSHLSESEPEYLLVEIVNAINGENYDEYFSMDVSPLTLQIVPPNIVIDNEILFPLSELKLLLEEWIVFCKSSFY